METKNACWYCGIEVSGVASACPKHLNEIEMEHAELLNDVEKSKNYGAGIGDSGIIFIREIPDFCEVCGEKVAVGRLCKYHYGRQWRDLPLLRDDGFAILKGDKRKLVNK